MFKIKIIVMFCLMALLTTLAFTSPPSKTDRTKRETSYHKAVIEKSIAVAPVTYPLTADNPNQAIVKNYSRSYCKECKAGATITLYSLREFRRTSNYIIHTTDKINTACGTDNYPFTGYLKKPAWQLS